MRYFVVLLLSVCGLTPAFAGVRELDMKKLQGEWVVESIFHDGEVQKLGGPARNWTFEKDRIIYKDREEGSYEVFQLDAHACPRRMTATSFRPGLASVDLKIIYKIEGDRLILCVDPENRAFPRSFTSSTGSGLRLIVLSRFKVE